MVFVYANHEGDFQGCDKRIYEWYQTKFSLSV